MKLAAVHGIAGCGRAVSREDINPSALKQKAAFEVAKEVREGA